MLDKILSFIAAAFTTKTATVTSTYATSIEVAKRAGAVSCRINDINNLPSGATIIGTLPAGYRPAVEITDLIESPSQSVTLRVTLYPNGNIRVYNYGAAITAATNAIKTFSFASGGVL